jgi:uncharacterized protein (UPF0212 family)
MKSYNVIRQVIYAEVIEVTAENEDEAIRIAETTPIGKDLEFVETDYYEIEE